MTMHQFRLQALRQAWLNAPDPKLIPLILSLTQDPLEKLLFRARQQVIQGQVEAALGLYQRYLEQKPGDLLVGLERAQLCVARRQFEQAKTLYLSLLQKHPDDRGLLFQSGSFFKEQEDIPLALKSFQALVTLEPNSFPAWGALAQTFLIAENFKESQRCFAQAQKLRALNADEAQAAFHKKKSYPDYFKRLSKKLKHDLDYLDYLLMHHAELPFKVTQSALRQQKQDSLDLLRWSLAMASVRELDFASAQKIDRVLDGQAYSYSLNSASHPPLNQHDFTGLETVFFQEQRHYAVLDDALTPDFLTQLYLFCLQANIWKNYLHGPNYFCAYPQDGLNQAPIYVLANALRKKLPNILGGHRLKKFWLYKYTSEANQGVQLHADSGAVNVNIWLTPDQGNLDAQSGGLTLYDQPLPLFASDSQFNLFNRDIPAMEYLLASSQAKAVDVVHRQNRMVIFDANLLHETMPYHFSESFALQRLNLTLMFGQRGKAAWQ